MFYIVRIAGRGPKGKFKVFTSMEDVESYLVGYICGVLYDMKVDDSSWKCNSVRDFQSHTKEDVFLYTFNDDKAIVFDLVGPFKKAMELQRN